MSNPPPHSSISAINLLKSHNIPVETRYYGFRILHPDLKDEGFMECGMDNDSSISISVHIEEDPPTAWFFRMNYEEIADLVISAYTASETHNPSRAEIVAAMRKINEQYDNTALNKMTAAFLGEIEDET